MALPKRISKMTAAYFLETSLFMCIWSKPDVFLASVCGKKKWENIIFYDLMCNVKQDMVNKQKIDKTFWDIWELEIKTENAWEVKVEQIFCPPKNWKRKESENEPRVLFQCRNQRGWSSQPFMFPALKTSAVLNCRCGGVISFSRFCGHTWNYPYRLISKFVRLRINEILLVCKFCFQVYSDFDFDVSQFFLPQTASLSGRLSRLLRRPSRWPSRRL